MQGKVKTIVQFKRTTRVLKIVVSGVEGKTCVDDANGNSRRWSKVKVGDCLLGLKWFDEDRKIVDADSDIEII